MFVASYSASSTPESREGNMLFDIDEAKHRVRGGWGIPIAMFLYGVAIGIGIVMLFGWHP